MADPRQLAARVRSLALDQPATLGDGDCEALRDAWWGQPTNTATSFAYVGAGGWLAGRLRRLTPTQRPAAGAYAALTVLTGMGSVAYHGPQFDGAQTAHDAPIVALAVLGAAVPAWRAATGRAALPGWTSRTGPVMAGTAAVGLAAYLGGRTSSPCCRPSSPFQLHGVWHLATAALMATWGTVLWRTEPDEGVAGA